MGRLIRRTAVFGLLLGLPWTLLAKHHRFVADSDDSPTDDATPSPSPAHHHKHAHSHQSPTASPTPDDDETASPAPKPRHKHPADEADTESDITPSPSPAHHHKHAHSHQSPTASPTPQDDETGSPTPKPRHKKPADEADSEADVTPMPASRKHHHSAEPNDSADAIPTPKPNPSPEDSDASDLPSVTPKPRPPMAPDASLDSGQLQEFSQQPEKIQALIEAALELTQQNLTYTFSSADPANGGMDCSGFIYYVLTQAGVKDVPRDASGQYSWVRKANKFKAVISRRLDGFELNELKPGDLLFWSGTYKTDHDPPVTHTMIYLGREKETGNRVMVGSTDGRSYHGLRRWGVSVFDFKAMASPSPGGDAPQFIGYGSIPGL